MAQLKHLARSTVLRNACIFFAFVVLSGCRDSSSRDISDAPFVQVMYEGQPLGDVQVRLHQVRGGPVIAQAVSGQDGNAYFWQIPSPEPSNYYVTVESLSDGSWSLTPEACQKISENISLKALESSPSQQLGIPDGAVIAISSPKRR